MSDPPPPADAPASTDDATPLSLLVDGRQSEAAVAIARGFVEASGIDLVCVPTFAEVDIDGERRTAIRLCVQDRGRSSAFLDSLDRAPGMSVVDCPTPWSP